MNRLKVPIYVLISIYVFTYIFTMYILSDTTIDNIILAVTLVLLMSIFVITDECKDWSQTSSLFFIIFISFMILILILIALFGMVG